MRGRIETYEQALEFLFSRINYEHTASGKYTLGDFKLDRMRGLLERLGNPQEHLPAIHIAGTKGKGSTAVMIAEMLSAAGYRTGLFTSPHVRDFAERMRVDGEQPSERELARLAGSVAAPVAEMDRGGDGMQPTYFEIATAMAWLYFVRKEAELVVLEVGLGGRLDATNICSPEVTVITNVSYDHTAVLGNRLAQIAREKGGIIKRGIPVISGVNGKEARAVVAKICRQRSARLHELGGDIRLESRSVHPRKPAEDNSDGERSWCSQHVSVSTGWRTWSNVPVPLPGEHQAQNAALSLAVVDCLNGAGRTVPPRAVHRGLSRVTWPLRIEVIREQPTVIVDAAHNTASAAALARTLNSEFPAGKRILVFAATRDKDVTGMLKELAPLFETIVLTQYVSNPRAVSVEALTALFRQQSGGPLFSAADPAEAWRLAESQAKPDDLICITGSFFLAAEMRELICHQRGLSRAV